MTVARVVSLQKVEPREDMLLVDVKISLELLAIPWIVHVAY
jgi:hypothetical protein